MQVFFEEVEVYICLPVNVHVYSDDMYIAE